MSRLIRWGLGLGLAVLLIVSSVVLIPFGSWLPGGTVADLPTQNVVNGSAFNALFPSPEPGTSLIFTQEKRGFAEARLKSNGELVALLAISDTETAPEARDKYKRSSESLQGWPLVEQGSNASALLVAGRYQIKVIDQNGHLDPAQRHLVLEHFDLDRLATLPPLDEGSANQRFGTSSPINLSGDT